MAYAGGNYTSAELHYVGARMASRTGLNSAICTTWATAEQGYGFNPYGVSKPGTVATRADFPSIDAGIDEAARWVNTFANYANIRANRGRSPLAQAYAIAASPWGPTGYYFRAFPQLGLAIVKGQPPSDWSNASAPAGSGPSTGGGLPGFPGDPGQAPRPPSSGGNPPGTLPPAGPTGPTAAPSDQLASILGKRPTDIFTSADIDKLYDWARAHSVTGGIPDFLGTGRATMHGLLESQVGKRIQDIQPSLYSGIVAAVATTTPGGQVNAGAADAVAVAGEAVSAAIGAVVPLVVGGLVLVAAAALILGGGRDALAS